MSDQGLREWMQRDLLCKIQSVPLLDHHSVCAIAGMPAGWEDDSLKRQEHQQPLTEWDALKEDSLASNEQLSERGELVERVCVEAKHWLSIIEQYKAAFHNLRELEMPDANTGKAQKMEEALLEAAKKRSQKEVASAQNILASTFTMLMDSLDLNDKGHEIGKLEIFVQKVESLCQLIGEVRLNKKSVAKELADAANKFSVKLADTAVQLKSSLSKAVIQKLVRCALSIGKLGSRFSSMLSVISKLIDNELYSSEYFPQVDNLKSFEPDFKYMIFDDKLKKKLNFELPKDLDVHSNPITESCHIVCDPTRLLIESGRNKLLLEKTSLAPGFNGPSNALPVLPLQYNFTGGYQTEAFSKLGGIWINEGSEVGPLTNHYNGYNRNFYYSYQNSSQNMSSCALPLMKDHAQEYRNDFFGFSGNDVGEIFISKFYRNRNDSTKYITSLLRYDISTKKHDYARIKSEVPLTQDGKLFHELLEGVKEANNFAIGHTVIMNTKTKMVLLANVDSGQILQYSSTPMIINGVDPHLMEVVSISSDKNALEFTSFDIFSRYDALTDESAQKLQNGSKLKVEEFGLLPNDESFDEDQLEEDLQNTETEMIEEKKEKDEKLEAQLKNTIEKGESAKLLSEQSVEGMAYYFRYLCSEVFSATLFTEGADLSKVFKESDFFLVSNAIDLVPATFSELAKICSFVQRAESTKFGSSLALSCLYFVYSHLQRTRMIQSNASEGPKILLQSTAVNLKKAVLGLNFKRETTLDLQWRTFNKLKTESILIICLMIRAPLVDAKEAQTTFETTLTDSVLLDSQLVSEWLHYTLVDNKKLRSPEQQSEIEAAFSSKLVSNIEEIGNLERKMIEEYFSSYPKIWPDFMQMKFLSINLKIPLAFLHKHWPSLGAETQGIITDGCSKNLAKLSDTLKKMGDSNKTNSSWSVGMSSELRSVLRHCSGVAIFELLFSLALKEDDEKNASRILFTSIAKDWVSKLADFKNEILFKSNKWEELLFNFKADEQGKVKFVKITNTDRRPLQLNIEWGNEGIVGDLFARQRCGESIMSLGLLPGEHTYDGYSEMFVVLRADHKLMNEANVTVKWQFTDRYEYYADVTDRLCDICSSYLYREASVQLRQIDLSSRDSSRLKRLRETGAVFNEKKLAEVLTAVSDGEWSFEKAAEVFQMTEEEQQAIDQLMVNNCGSEVDKAKRLLFVSLLRLEPDTIGAEVESSKKESLNRRLDNVLKLLSPSSAISAEVWQMIAFFSSIERNCSKAISFDSYFSLIKEFSSADLKHLLPLALKNAAKYQSALEATENILTLTKHFPSMSRNSVVTLLGNESQSRYFLGEFIAQFKGEISSKIEQSMKKITEILSNFIAIKKNENDDCWDTYMVLYKSVALDTLAEFLSYADPIMAGLDISKIINSNNEKDAANNTDSLKKSLARFSSLTLSNLVEAAKRGEVQAAEILTAITSFMLNDAKGEESKFLQDFVDCGLEIPHNTYTRNKFHQLEVDKFRHAVIAELNQQNNVAAQVVSNMEFKGVDDSTHSGPWGIFKVESRVNHLVDFKQKESECLNACGRIWSFCSQMRSPVNLSLALFFRTLLRVILAAQELVLSSLCKKRLFLETLQKLMSKCLPSSILQTIIRILARMYSILDESAEKEKQQRLDIKNKVLARCAHRSDLIIPAVFQPDERMVQLDELYFQGKVDPIPGLTRDKARDHIAHLLKKKKEGQTANEKHKSLRQKLYLHVQRKAERSDKNDAAKDVLSAESKIKKPWIDPKFITDHLTLPVIRSMEESEKVMRSVEEHQVQEGVTSSQPTTNNQLSEVEAISQGVMMDALLDFGKRVPSDIRKIVSLRNGSMSPQIDLSAFSHWIAITDKGQTILSPSSNQDKTFLEASRTLEVQMIVPSLMNYAVIPQIFSTEKKVYKWRGYYVSNGVHSMMNFREITIGGDGNIQGGGTDEVGAFSILGSVSLQDEVNFVKYYYRAHTVNYNGKIDRFGTIKGTWDMSGQKGEFQIEVMTKECKEQDAAASHSALHKESNLVSASENESNVAPPKEDITEITIRPELILSFVHPSTLTNDGIPNKTFIQLKLNSEPSILNFEESKKMNVLVVPCVPKLSPAELSNLKSILRPVMDRQVAVYVSQIPELKRLVHSDRSALKLETVAKEKLCRYLLMDWVKLWGEDLCISHPTGNVSLAPTKQISGTNFEQIERKICEADLLKAAFFIAEINGKRTMDGRCLVDKKFNLAGVASSCISELWQEASLKMFEQLANLQIVKLWRDRSNQARFTVLEGADSSELKKSAYEFGLTIGLAMAVHQTFPVKPNSDFVDQMIEHKCVPTKLRHFVQLGLLDFMCLQGLSTQEEEELRTALGVDKLMNDNFSTVSLVGNTALRFLPSNPQKMEQKPTAAEEKAPVAAIPNNSTLHPQESLNRQEAEEEDVEVSLGGLFD